MIFCRSAVAAAVTLAAMGCGYGRMVPANASQVVPQARGTAFSIIDGVRCSASGDAWRGIPKDLAESVTPVKVRIRNNSGKPIRLLYQHFALVGEGGRKYYPLPILPIDLKTLDGGPSVRPTFAASNFFVAPRFGKIYTTLEPWSSPLPRDRKFYKRQYAEWEGNLPTQDMMAQALPEGVLADEGVITGFLYFENATGDEDRIVFTAEMNEGEGDEVVAVIEIPFRID